MFEKIVLRRSQIGPGLTPGELAEALLFYKNVHLVIDHGSFKSLLDSLGAQEILALLAHKRISAFFAEDMFLTMNEPFAHGQAHWFESISIGGQGEEQPRKGRKGRLALLFEMNGYSPREAQKYADRFLEYARMSRFSSDYFIPGGIPRAAMTDLADASYVLAAVRRVLRDTIGFEAFADALDFEIIQMPKKFRVQTNIDFQLGNARRKSLNPALEEIGESSLLGAIVEARADISVAAQYGGDFHTSAISSDIVRLKHAELLKRSGISEQELLQFKNIILRDYPTIREVINSGERSFDDFKNLLEKSDKFRQSIHTIGPDDSLVAEYFREITKEGWAATLPAKAVRYVVGMVLGKIPGVAEIYSAADTFLLDKVGRGWRPNHFVDGKLKPFLDP
jgi:hypothetical protein